MNALGFLKIIINIIIKYYNLLDLIIINQKLLFTSKFLTLLSYFFNIKKK